MKVMNYLEALKVLMPILEKYDFTWVITGGFAVIAYSIERPLSDIDIDIKCSKDDQKFKDFVEEMKPYTTQELIHWTDENYDNYNFEITIAGQLIDICPMHEMKVIDTTTGTYQPFYSEDFSEIETVEFQGLRLPLLPKRLIIKNKQMLAMQRDIDRQDIAALQKIL